MASISSMNMIQGAFSLACLNRISNTTGSNSNKHFHKITTAQTEEGTWASPATALANKVLPVPGGPISKAPFGIFPPSAVYFLGIF
jgi:hypothetical protein